MDGDRNARVIAPGMAAANRPTEREVIEAYEAARRAVSFFLRGESQADRDDAVQDMAVAMLERDAAKFDRALGKFSSFVGRQSRNRAIDTMRGIRGRFHGPAADDTQIPDGRAVSADVVTEAAKLWDAFADAVPSKTWGRRAFLLWVKGTDETEIATMVGEHKSSVSRSIRECVIWICRLRAIPIPALDPDMRERSAPAIPLDPRQAALFSTTDATADLDHEDNDHTERAPDVAQGDAG